MRMAVETYQHDVRRASLITARLALLVLIACTDTNASNAAGASTSGDVAAKSGVWSEGDEKSTWTATRDDANTWRIDEAAQFGEDGRAARRFLFDSMGTLRTASDEKQQTAQRGNASPGLMRSVLQVDFTGDSATHVSKQVDGTERQVQAFEIENARRHAHQLWTLARQSASRP